MKQASAGRILADLFPGRERTLFAAVLVMGAVTATFETLGVAAILPFMALMVDPDALTRYPVIAEVAQSVGVGTPRGQLLLLGATVVGLVVVASITGALNVFIQQRFVARTMLRLASGLFTGYLRQPYAFHVQRDTPSLIKVVSTDVRVVINGAVSPLLIAIAKSLVAVGILGVVVVQDPLLAFIVASVLGTVYTLIFTTARKHQRRLGQAYSASNEQRQRIAQEGLGSIKELRVLGREDSVMARFHAAEAEAAHAEAMTRVTAQLPRYAIEAIAFGGILLLAIGPLAVDARSTSSVIPLLTLYTFAAFRMLPALQQVFTSAVYVRFSLPSIRKLHQDFMAVASPNSPTSQDPPIRPQLPFTHYLRVENVTFAYHGAATPALTNVTLHIARNQSVGLIGRTGSGKTTLADLLIGLYEPDRGCIHVDDVELRGPAVRAWQRKIGYVPQHVFLGNATVAENIAFGLPPDRIDWDAVTEAAHLAHVDEFVRSLSRGFDTVIGERGVQLSGGQRQRIGIARALYHRPEVLVLDEATSALDSVTEKGIMNALNALRGERTVIIIAHRLRTVRACDRIVLLERGRVIADGHYDNLLETSIEFGELVRGGADVVTVG